jgi:hypothetical protein
MPTFVIHTLGKPSRKTTIARGPIRVGRDPASQLVLGDDTVSRDHAVFDADRAGNWSVACVSATNPIVVDGKLVKQSRLERADDHEPARRPLGERQPVEISRSKDAVLRLFGLTFGGNVRVAWSGARFAATSTVFFPAMKINGVRTKSAPLSHDDVIEIGSNRFRFVTEEGAIAALLR